MFNGLLEGRIASVIADCICVDDIIEVRMRINRPLVLLTIKGRKVACTALGVPYIATREDIDRVLAIASNFSIYSVNDELVKGYIPCGTVRLGVCGEGVSDSGKLITLKNICFVAIRVPHQVTGAADGVIARVLQEEVKNTLIISPPGAGKTTMLRELARLTSKKHNTLIIDERFEIASCDGGVPRLDVGECDIVSGVMKAVAYENSIRAMNPEVIVTDELFKKVEVEAVVDIVRSGVKVFASVHGKDFESIQNSALFSPLVSCFDLFIVLGKTPQVGAIREVVEI